MEPDDIPYPDWTSLPEHVLGKIFCYLPEAARYNASVVCSRWNAGFLTPSTWRAFHLSIRRTMSGHRKDRKIHPYNVSGLPHNLLEVIAKHVRHLNIECPWSNEDRIRCQGVSQRMLKAIADLTYRGCQIRTLVLRNFDRISLSWYDQKARFNMIKALKRFIHTQRNLSTLDFRYALLKQWEVEKLLNAAALRSAKTVTTINLQGAILPRKYSHLFLLDNRHPNHNGAVFHPRGHHNEWRIQHHVHNDQRRPENTLGLTISRFTSLRDLYLILDVNVLAMNLLRFLPGTMRLLKFIARNGEMDSDGFAPMRLASNPLCDNAEWRNLTERCPRIALDFDMRGILWYYPLNCILQPMAPLKRIRIFSAFKGLRSSDLIPFLFHLLGLFSDNLEEVDVCMLRRYVAMDDFLFKLHHSCKNLKSFRFRGSVRKPGVIKELSRAFFQRDLSIERLNITVETYSATLFEELRSTKGEISKWLQTCGNESYAKGEQEDLSEKSSTSHSKISQFHFGIIKMPPRRNIWDWRLQ